MSDGAILPEGNGSKPPRSMWNLAFISLWAGQALSAFGQSVYLLALYWVVQQQTGSTAMTGLVGMVLFLPAVLSPITGVLADRWNRSLLMFLSEALRTLAILGLVALGLMGVPLSWQGMVMAGLGISLTAQFFGPARLAVVPELVAVEQLTSANGALFIGEQGGSLIGSVLGGMLVATSMTVTLHTTAGIFFGSALALAYLWYLATAGDRGRAVCVSAEASDLQWRAGIRLVVSNRRLRILFTAAAVLFGSFAPLMVLMPAWAQDHLRTDAQGYGVLEAALPIGMGVGGAVAGTLAKRLGNFPSMVLGTIAAGLAIVVVSLQASLLSTAVMLVAVGIPLAVGQVTLTTAIQEHTAEQLRGRVFGLFNTVVAGAMTLGMGVSGLAAQASGVQLLWQLAGGLFCGVGILLWRSRNSF